jgi:hypothetical protein
LVSRARSRSPGKATRIIDTRQSGSAIGAGSVQQVAQGNDVVANNPTLVLNLTVTNTTAASFLTAYADGTTRPAAAAMNWTTGQTLAAFALPATGNGTVDLYNNGGSADVIVDCTGYFSTS